MGFLDDAKKKLGEAVGHAKEFAGDASGNLKDFAEDASQNVKEFAADAQEKIGEKVEEFKNGDRLEDETGGQVKERGADPVDEA